MNIHSYVFQRPIFRGSVRLQQCRVVQLRRTRLNAATQESQLTKAQQNAKQKEVKVVSEAPLLKSDESDEHLRIRHTCAHVMAMAVQRVIRDSQVTIGPWTEYGFWYDFDLKGASVGAKQLKQIKKQMDKIIKAKLDITCEEVSQDEAKRRIEAINEPYKLQILESIIAKDPNAPITIYHIGKDNEKWAWWDLCAGPHVSNTGDLDAGAVQLETTTNAYWRGDSNNELLTRIKGTAFSEAAQLEYYNYVMQQAELRDHRKLGQQLDLFSISQDVGSGLVMWHPNGACIRNIIETFWKQIHMDLGYQLLYTPHVGKIDLWRTSGHYDFYRDSMFSAMSVDDSSSSNQHQHALNDTNGAEQGGDVAATTNAGNQEYMIRPMNCPYHVQVYKSTPKSYRQLPIRYENQDSLSGLFRVRGFTQDDAHIFCTVDQITQELCSVLQLVEKLLSTFGFDKYIVNLSTRPDKSVGSDDLWQRAEEGLREALSLQGWEYTIDAGGGAFYGPKIDIKIKDAIGRQWQCSTIQLDFNLPDRFQMTYTDENDDSQRPIMIHRAVLGSIERFFGILIENYAGAFPLWLAPTQVLVVPVFEKEELRGYVREVVAAFSAAGVRCEAGGKGRFKKQIREAEVRKVPVVCVVGEKEREGGVVSVRTYQDGEVGVFKLEEVVEGVRRADVEKKGLELGG